MPSRWEVAAVIPPAMYTIGPDYKHMSIVDLRYIVKLSTPMDGKR